MMKTKMTTNEDDNKGFTFGSSLGAYIQNIL